MLSDRAKALCPMIQAAYDTGGVDGVGEAVAGLIAPLETCVEQLMSRVAELEKRLNMNSSNSSKPPSSDGLKRKTKSRRPKNTGHKRGGQPGHPGQPLQQSPPDIPHSFGAGENAADAPREALSPSTPLSPSRQECRDSLLTNLVALKQERAAAEKHGLIRWLRPQEQETHRAKSRGFWRR